MTIKNLHFNILLGLNSFIVFFLLFEGQIQIPVYLQVFGRMHPLLLHFPIVLLILTWLIFLIRRKLEQSIPSIGSIIQTLLFISSLFIAITVIMGLFLSKEGGFEGRSYEWHKYTGVLLSLLSMGLLAYLRFNKKTGYHVMFTIGIHAALLTLLLVGHFGASLTHGEDFITSPLLKKESNELDPESAIVFEDAVMPILKAKCMSCHNSNKPKGDLVLSDSTSILKGGKHGKLFLAGNPLGSLMIERLLLDIEHQHRMPPKGKPQLSIDEIALLKAWVKSGGKFDVPLSAFTDQDTLYQSVKAVYGFEKDEVYTFAAADEDDIQKLTTPYRIIKSIDANSPALDVNFYGKDFFTDKSLSELMPIAGQIVSLNLSSMPVRVEDIQTLKKFKNLRILNLNNTAISNEGIIQLTAVSGLKNVSLIGTKVDKTGLEKLAAMPQIRKVYIWNSLVKSGELDDIKRKYPSLKIDAGAKLDESQKLVLTSAKISPSRSFFQNDVEIMLSHPVNGVELRYTLDGSDPDSIGGIPYKSPFIIRKDAVLRVKGKKEGWLPSPEISQSFYATFIKPQKVVLESKPNPLYRARKEESFFDLESGGVNNADGKWLGFQGNDFSTNLFFDSAVKIDTLALSLKQDYGQHIYPPEYVEIWGGPTVDNLVLVNKVRLELDKVDKMRNRRIVVCSMPDKEVQVIRVKTKHYAKIPEGFPGSGSSPWLFVDEILLK